MRARTIATSGMVLAALVAVSGPAMAEGMRFSDFTPLETSAGPTSDESHPITFGNPGFQQRSIASRAEQLLAGEPNSGVWDMNTVNETGQQKGRHLFTPFESGQSGIQRTELASGDTKTIWYSPASVTTSAGTPPSGRPGARTSPPSRIGASAPEGATPTPTAGSLS